MNPLIERMYGRYFNGHLGQNEHLIDAIPAISEQVAEVRREDREGTLGLTNERLLFVSMTGVPWHQYGLLEIRSAVSGRILLPGQSWLVLLHEGEGVARFMVGKKQIRFFLPELQAEIKRVAEVERKGTNQNAMFEDFFDGFTLGEDGHAHNDLGDTMFLKDGVDTEAAGGPSAYAAKWKADFALLTDDEKKARRDG